jgi:hypothetical protein
MTRLAAGLVAATAATGALMFAMPAAQAATPSAAPTGVAHVTGAPHGWGPLYTPGAKRARAQGSVTATGEDHKVIPAAATLKVSGRIYDLTRSSSTCGWAVFEIAVVTPTGNNLTLKQHSVRTCDHRKPKPFTFTYRNVYQVEVKVCAEGNASGPSIQCTAGGTWKILYLSPH